MSTPETRVYRSRLRDQQAAQTRARILDAAAEEFSRRGYAGTTLGSIAATAGVSAETVKTVGAKHEILLAAFQRTFAGREGDELIADDPGVQEALAPMAPAELAPFFAAAVAEYSARGARLWVAFSAAAQSDEAVDAVRRAVLVRRMEDHGRVVDLLADAGLVGASASRTELAAALAHVASPEGYLLLVDGYGWSVDRYRSWLADAVLRTVA